MRNGLGILRSASNSRLGSWTLHGAMARCPPFPDVRCALLMPKSRLSWKDGYTFRRIGSIHHVLNVGPALVERLAAVRSGA